MIKEHDNISSNKLNDLIIKKYLINKVNNI
jgi:hypothetical protein